MFNQKKYINGYNKKCYKMYPFRVRKENKKIINKLNSVKSMNSYILSLIEEDINSNILTIKQIKERCLPIFLKHGINEIYLFGSYARGEATSDSDVDIYCDSGDIKTIIEQGFLEDELKKVLKKDVDLIFFGTKMEKMFNKELEVDKIKIC